MAVNFGSLAIARTLLDGGADVDARNADGATALHGAAFFGRAEALELLLDNGADPEAENDQGQTAQDAAVDDWATTQMVANFLQIPLDRQQVEAGRERCVELLEGER